ncbi:serpin family protein [Kitasatospora sp. NPDC052896]|uniref:serpin family protein n=1 Tax=Kitasatospora sp. NPDC052896 TaxID=3364061 RepID=UPI0037CCB9D1
MRVGRTVAALLVAAAVAGCASGPTARPAAQVLRVTATAAPPAPAAGELAATAAGTDAFGVALYRQLTAQGGQQDLVLSPSGLATALAMLLPGARGTTAQELATVLHTSLPPERYAVAMGALDRAAQPAGAGRTPTLVLREADSVWTQQGYPVQPGYLQTLAQAFDTGLRTADFAKDPDGARKAVNALVEQQTDGQIKDLFGPGAVDASTLLALTDALYLKAQWQHPFEQAATTDRPFHLLDGSTPQVATMAQTATFRYAEGSAGAPWQAVELPYAGGDLAMDLIVPAQGGLDAFRSGLDAAELDRILGGLSDASVDLTLPRFGFETGDSLVPALTALGLRSAFGPGADLSGIPTPGTTPQPRVGAVVQKARISVDEAGTTAAAGSGVAVGTTAVRPPARSAQLHIDRPFLFLIRDTATGQPLFLGQVTDPRQ